MTKITASLAPADPFDDRSRAKSTTSRVVKRDDAPIPTPSTGMVPPASPVSTSLANDVDALARSLGVQAEPDHDGAPSYPPDAFVRAVLAIHATLTQVRASLVERQGELDVRERALAARERAVTKREQEVQGLAALAPLFGAAPARKSWWRRP